MFKPDAPPISFLLRSSIFISLCAACLSVESSLVVGKAGLHFDLVSLVFFCTLFAYNLYYIRSSAFPYYKPLSVLGLIGLVLALIRTDALPWPSILLASFLSALYIGMALFRKNEPALPYYPFLKNALLVMIWVVFTFLMPTTEMPLNSNKLLWLVYHINLIAFIALLFMMNDRPLRRFKIQLFRTAMSFAVFNILLSLLAALFLHSPYGWSSAITSILMLLIGRKTFQQNTNQHDLLFYADGIMLIQSIFVAITYWLIV